MSVASILYLFLYAHLSLTPVIHPFKFSIGQLIIEKQRFKDYDAGIAPCRRRKKACVDPGPSRSAVVEQQSIACAASSSIDLADSEPESLRLLMLCAAAEKCQGSWLSVVR